MATIKQHLQNVAQAVGLLVPDSFVSNSEDTARRLLRAASSAGRHLATRDWRALTCEYTFTTQDGITEYSVPATPRFHHLKPATAFDRSMYREMDGPHGPADWQYAKALLATSGSITRRFRIATDTADTPRVPKIYLLDDPAGEYTLAFEYVTDQWLLSGSGYVADIVTDNDEPVFDTLLFEAECTWRTLRANGEAYFDEKDEAVRLADRLYAQENGAPIRMNRRRVMFADNIPETGYGL